MTRARARAFLALTIFTVPSHAAGQPSDGERNAALYMASVSMSKSSTICAARVAGFSEEFNPALARWRGENANALRAGEAFLRAAATAEHKDFERVVGDITNIDLRLLETAPTSVIGENCKAMLERIGAYQRPAT